MNTHDPVPVLMIDGLAIRFGPRTLFADMNLTVAAEESVVVTGPSGSGKSSLLSCVLGLMRPSTGTIVVGSCDVTRAGGRQLAMMRRGVGMVFQTGELMGELSPSDNVAVAGIIAGMPAAQAADAADDLLAALGVPRDRATTDELSGGERQRTALARALINRPPLVLADEPTAALDAKARDDVASALFEAPQRWGCALLVVTHDLSVAKRAGRVLEIESSLVRQRASVEL